MPQPSSITVTLEGDPTRINLRPEVVDILVSLSTGDNPSQQLAKWLVARINTALETKLQTDVILAGGPITDEDIVP